MTVVIISNVFVVFDLLKRCKLLAASIFCWCGRVTMCHYVEHLGQLFAI